MALNTPQKICLTLCVVAFCPIVSSTRLAKDKIVRSEDLSIGTAADAVHGSRLKINEHSPGNILSARGFIVVDVNPLQLEVRVTLVGASGIHAMLVGDDLPELGPDLVAALAGLDVHDLPHFLSFCSSC